MREDSTYGFMEAEGGPDVLEREDEGAPGWFSLPQFHMCLREGRKLQGRKYNGTTLIWIQEYHVVMSLSP